jgi:hypothetical protein
MMRREAEERKEAAARKVAAERRDFLAQQKVAREVAAAEEERQSLATGLSGLKLTIPAPASIARTTLGSSTQSKGKRKAIEEEPSASRYVSECCFSFIADFLWRSKFPSCDLCTIANSVCSTELRKNGTQRTSCDRCWQLKKACHWDLVGVMGPRDPDASKRARKSVKKPVIDVDDVKDTGDEVPSLAADIVSSSFILWNAANALITESAALRATFIQFHDTISGSLDKLTEFLVEEQAEAREDRHAVLGLLQRLVAAAAEGAPSRQMEIVPAAVAGNAEACPSGGAAGLIRRARTPLFLPSDENTEPSNESYVDEAKGSGSEESSADENADVEEDVDEDAEEADEMDVDQTLRN